MGKPPFVPPINLIDAKGRSESTEHEIVELEFQRQEITRKISEKSDELHNLISYISNPNNRIISVSDHVIVRYLERKHGMDLNSVRAEILALIPNHVIGMKSFNVKTKDGGKIVVKDSVVVTIT